ncbi:hypothetical protein VTK73DRAFT_5944 [Phialemonium thermophilum]|uniref:Secreted protein n=1 Tax=Phialemonium thermophilum TaxID=223376 RepID=A0ABR3V093_9PEZI
MRGTRGPFFPRGARGMFAGGLIAAGVLLRISTWSCCLRGLRVRSCDGEARFSVVLLLYFGAEEGRHRAISFLVCGYASVVCAGSQQGKSQRAGRRGCPNSRDHRGSHASPGPRTGGRCSPASGTRRLGTYLRPNPRTVREGRTDLHLRAKHEAEGL